MSEDAADVTRWRNRALRYLGRYAASRAHLRRVLLRKAQRLDEPLPAATLDAMLDDLERLGLLDDTSYATARARSLHAAGRSPRAIRARLAARGLGRDDVQRAVAELADSEADAELAAARTFARRKRLGPWRVGERDAARETLQLRRAGFSYQVVRRVVAADGEDELD